MNRGLAMLAAVVVGGLAAFTVVLAIVAAVGGILWLYVFGDNPWPLWLSRSLDIAIPVIGLASWALFGWIIWNRLTAPATS